MPDASIEAFALAQDFIPPIFALMGRVGVEESTLLVVVQDVKVALRRHLAR
jgi:hypothetical protein